MQPHWRLRCPLCQSEFDGAFLAKQMPPSLVVVSAGQPSPTQADGDFVIQLSEPPPMLTAKPFELEQRATSSSQTPSQSNLRSKIDSARVPRSPVVEIVKIALGGLAAIPLVQLLVWWGLGKDPMEVAPKLPAVVRWLAPAKLQASGTMNQDDNSNGIIDSPLDDNIIRNAKSRSLQPADQSANLETKSELTKPAKIESKQGANEKAVGAPNAKKEPPSTSTSSPSINDVKAKSKPNADSASPTAGNISPNVSPPGSGAAVEKSPASDAQKPVDAQKKENALDPKLQEPSRPKSNPPTKDGSQEGNQPKA
jgi:hypothetical protein